MKLRRGFVHITFLFGLVILVILGVIIYLYIENNKGTTTSELAENTNGQQVNPSPIPTSVEKKTISLPKDIEDALSNAFNTKSNLRWSGDGNDTHVSINTYKYEEGSKVKVYYYGQAKEYNLDKEVDTIKSLKYGKNIALIEGPYDGIDNSNNEVIFNKIGKRDYGYYHHSFAPASTDGRQYFTYDEDNMLLIYLDVSFYSTNNQLSRVASEIDGSIIVRQFPQRYLDFLSSFEQEFLAKY